MPRKHTLVVALSLAFAAVVGTIALTKTVHLGQASAKPVSPTVISKRTRQLDRFEASLMAALEKKPPAIPKLPPTPVVSAAPAAPPVSAPVAAPAAAPAPPQRVVYVRPAPIIIHKHRAGGEHESEGSDHGDGGGSSAIGGGGGND